MNKNVIILIVLLLVAGLIYMQVRMTTGDKAAVQENPYGLPDALVVNGAPVDPVCFMVLGGEGSKTLTLGGCAQTYKLTDIRQEVTEDNYITSMFKYTSDAPDAPPSMIRYKYLGETEKGYTVLVESSGGGTGQFSSVYTLGENNGDLEILDTIAGGDRCNGGIESASVVEGELIFNQYVTPFDFLDLADNNPYGLKAYDDLEACAACCYGIARYNGEGFKGISVIIDAERLDSDDASPERGMQNCFDKVLKSRMDIGQIDMPTEVVKSFVQEFHAACTVQ